jgi:hypothetical protein
MEEKGRELSIEELQKRFDEISALTKKTLPQVEEMKILQIQIESQRKENRERS